MNSEIGGIPFIGENGYYPRWARGSSRWVFQRTTIIIGQMGAQMASLHSMQVPLSDQIVVWAPPNRMPIFGTRPSAIHQERQRALTELESWRLVCYGDQCNAPKPGSSSGSIQAASTIRESGVQPNNWLLLCPSCGASVGPDVADITVEPLIERWRSTGRPRLENPGAGWNLQPIASIADLPQWVQTLQPNHLELAYLGQQMWKNIESMLKAMKEARNAI
jgi:hypothetical protein